MILKKLRNLDFLHQTTNLSTIHSFTMELKTIDSLVKQLKVKPSSLDATLKRIDEFFGVIQECRPMKEYTQYMRRFLFLILYEPYIHVPTIFHETDGLADKLGAMDFLIPFLFDKDRWVAFKERVKKDLDHANDYELRLASQDDFLEVLEQCLEKRKKKLYEECQKRMDILRQDLMEKAWHPRRVERWLEIGGFELLEALQ